MLRKRSEMTIGGPYYGHTWTKYDPVGATTPYSFISTKRMTDEVHDWPPPGGIGDVGGFLEQDIFQFSQPRPVEMYATNGTYFYRGPLFAYSSSVDKKETNFPSTQRLTAFEMIAAGATAISRCAPSNPHASVCQTLGELRRDGIPAIPALNAFKEGGRPLYRAVKRRKDPRRRKSTVSSPTYVAGSEYLNVVFGWKPLLSDIRKLALSARESEKVLKQYARDSGRLVRCHYEFPATESTVTTTDMGLRTPPPNLVSPLYSVPQGRVTMQTTSSKRVWFDGAFTYHVSDNRDLIGRVRRLAQDANHLTGVGITPGALWDLSPWSWAADWFANTGDVLNNISMQITDGLVVVYGYVMCESIAVTTFTNEGARLTGSGQPQLHLQQTFKHISRQRLAATPFGFGVNLGALSSRQLAIVAALGLSKNGRKLTI